MTDSLTFDTPENIQIRYRPAGLGTRFIAWIIDQLLALLIEFALLIGVVMLVSTVESFRSLFDVGDRGLHYVAGLVYLIFGLGNLLYFMLCELLMRGQTFGKRWCGIQVVKADGFGLDAGAIVVRNIFRLIDSIPVTWAVPLFSKRSQRLGDMVAGTVVVSEQRPEYGTIRGMLAARPAGDVQFRFSSAGLARLPQQEFEAVERLLERWTAIDPLQRASLARRLTDGIARRLQVEPPPVEREHDFLLDLTAAELRRREQGLG